MNPIQRIAAAIDYPDPVSADAAEFAFLVDDGEVHALAERGELRLERELWRAESDAEYPPLVQHLAELAAGRVFREAATLAWDQSRQTVFLWQNLSANASDASLRRFFEEFTAACDWWLERIHETTEAAPVFPEMIIRP